MTSSSTESKPLRERLLPQTSIRFFLILIALSAVVMYILRAAVVGDQMWAKIASLLMATATASFLAYACLFVLAQVFTASTAPLLRSADSATNSMSGQRDDATSPAGDP